MNITMISMDELVQALADAENEVTRLRAELQRRHDELDPARKALVEANRELLSGPSMARRILPPMPVNGEMP
jgi:hypothetical protein